MAPSMKTMPKQKRTKPMTSTHKSRPCVKSVQRKFSNSNGTQTAVWSKDILDEDHREPKENEADDQHAQDQAERDERAAHIQHLERHADGCEEQMTSSMKTIANQK